MTHVATTLDAAFEEKISARDDAATHDVATNDAATNHAATLAREPISVPAASGRARIRSLRPALLAGAALLAITAAGDFGWNYWTTGQFEVSTDDAYVQADNSIIAPKISGYLNQVLVSDNQTVKAGQPLARIDDRDYAVAVDQAKADVAAAQAEVDNVQANLSEQQAVIAQAHATVSVDQANLTFAHQDDDRYSSLARSGAASVQNQQQALSKMQMAQSTLQRDQAAVLAAERRIEMLRAQQAKAEAVVAHDNAVLEQARLNLSYTTIVAPMDGVVGNRTLRDGQYVQAGTQLMAIVPIHDVYVVANYKETQLTGVHAGQPVDIEVDTFPGQLVHGHVDSIAPASGQEFALLPPDNATGNFTKIVQRIPVKIALDADDPLAGRLRPGMSVTPSIDTKAPEALATN
jgi:membrane fusion protein, multidrug efflux system